MIESIPGDGFKIWWTHPPSIDLLENQVLPTLLTRARLKSLAGKGFLTIQEYKQEWFGPGHRARYAFSAKISPHKFIDIWEIEIEPVSYQIIENNFRETAVIGTLNINIPKLTKNQRELATYLVHKSLELNPEEPPENFSFTLTAGTVDARHPPSIQFKAYPREYVDFEPLDIEPLVKADIIVRHSKIKHMYTMTQDLYDLVANNFQETTDHSDFTSVFLRANSHFRTLLETMDKRFSKDDMKNILIGRIDYDNLSGDRKIDHFRDLIEQTHRANQLDELLLLLASEAPDIEWAKFRS